MYKKIAALRQLHFAIFVSLLFCFQINAQTKETLIRKFSNGVEIYQRKSETAAIYDHPIFSDIVNSDGGKMEKTEFAVQKLEILLKNPASKQEEIIWSKTLKFPKNERVFNYFVVRDVFGRNGKYYVLYFRRLSLQVETIVRVSDKYSAENDTFLASTSESHNPIIEAKFIGKKPKIMAKRNYGGLDETIYEWKLKKGKWVLTKEKFKVVLPRFKRNKKQL